MPVKKTTKKKTLTAADGLAVAIQTELEGFEFYIIAAKKSKDEGAKKMFESLAADELRHRDMLNDQYQLIIQGKDFKPFKKPPRSRFKVKSPVFSREFLESKKKKNFEMSALSIGIMLEQNAIEFYRQQKESSRDPKAKKLFHELAVWEGEHLRALIAQKRFLQRAIFDEARFEPF
ncbi:MAG: ferritin family protein [Candidatus Zixiibacteriota bacterium]|nr:MAG: ferritin family protein [candidate division Zixibacteria bacterium]